MPHLSPKGPLLLGHCRALALCSGLIFSLRNRLGLDDRSGVVVYNHLEELAIFHRVNGELQFPFLHLELGGNWLAVTRARRQTTLEGHPSAPTAFASAPWLPSSSWAARVAPQHTAARARTGTRHVIVFM